MRATIDAAAAEEERVIRANSRRRWVIEAAGCCRRVIGAEGRISTFSIQHAADRPITRLFRRYISARKHTFDAFVTRRAGSRPPRHYFCCRAASRPRRNFGATFHADATAAGHAPRQRAEILEYAGLKQIDDMLIID